MRAYSAVAYGVFQGSFLYFVLFVCGFIPGRPEGDGLAVALAIDAGLVVLFGATHSLMARKPFKRWLTARIPAAAERSTYVLVASLELAFLCWQWRPIAGPTLWSAAGPLAVAMTAAQILGFGIALVSTYLIDHFALFGLRQAFAPHPDTDDFRTPLFYRAVRHPLYLGILIAIWLAPQMTAGRLTLAATLTLYIVVGTLLEERDLVAAFGERYRAYQRDVPRYIPRLFRRARREEVARG